jgi:2',3'-cyclic-nucleotide 2'-phosphodiesterase (5'-nucleotidase family)
VEDAKDLPFGAGDVTQRHLLDEQPHQERSARDKMSGNVVQALGLLAVGSRL